MCSNLTHMTSTRSLTGQAARVAPEGVRMLMINAAVVKAARKIPKFTASPTASITAAIIAAHGRSYACGCADGLWPADQGQYCCSSSEKARTRSFHDLTRSRETLSRERSRAETLLCDATLMRADIIGKKYSKIPPGGDISTHTDIPACVRGVLRTG